MEKVRQLERTVIRYTIILVAALILLSIIAFRSVPVVIGLVFGTAIALLNFIELSRTLQVAVTKSPEKASAYTTFKYFIRFAIMGVVLYVAAVTDYIDLLGTIVGLLSVKLVVYATNLFSDRQFFANIFKRKEE